MAKRVSFAIDFANNMLEENDCESSCSDFSGHHDHYGTNDFHNDFTAEKGRDDEEKAQDQVYMCHVGDPYKCKSGQEFHSKMLKEDADHIDCWYQHGQKAMLAMKGSLKKRMTNV